LSVSRNGVLGVFVAVLLALGVLASGATSQASAALQVSTQPSLFPSFDPSVPDYVVRCEPADSVQVSVSTPQGTSVSVDGGPSRGGSFTQTVSLRAGQRFNITVIKSSVSTNYVIRCLPSDFPAFTATRSGPMEAQWYVVAPGLGGAPPGVSQQYVAFFDRDGVPVWWMRSAGSTVPLDAKLLANGDVAWLHAFPSSNPGAEEHRLNGSLVRTLDTVTSGADHHDIQLLPNGDYLVGRYFDRSGVDMSACGGSTTGHLVDFELQELTPDGALVWSWRASDHIPLSEVAVEWQDQCSADGSGDVYHWNAVEPDGDGYVLSFRHLDAVYRIDKATGAIDWKLGGVPRPESLTVVGDPLSAVSTFCGQHDARVLSDGSLTVHDNGTRCNRSPRAVRFAIDTTANPPTATLLEDLTDGDATNSGCCGSARRLPGGDWVTDWGSNPYVTELTATGVRVFKLSFTGLFSYRANPVLPGQVTRRALREGMNAQYPRSAGGPSAVTGPASSIASTSATLNGTVNPNGETTSYRFNYGTTTSYGHPTPWRSAGSGTSDQSVSANLSGLEPNTTYHFRLVAIHADGQKTLGSDQTFTTTEAYATVVLGTPGLLSYWRLGEGSGVTATDSKDTRDGTYNGGFTLGQPGATADANTSVAFDGSSGYFSTPANPGGAQGTIEFWGYATDLDSRNGVVYTADDGISTYSHQIGVNADGSARLYFSDGAPQSVDTASGLIATNTWHYYALVWSDGGSADLYIDGTKQASVAIGSSWKGGDKLLFGHAAGVTSGLTNPWQGRIDEAAVYDQALSATTIQRHYGSR
jgi:arylsulfotransferase ASST/concanavalin A-like lectin/glucanase superfamily protein